MNRAGVFGICIAGAIVGSVAGALAVDRRKGAKRIGQQPYAAIGSGLIATAAAAVLYNAASCPVCPDGTVSTPPGRLGIGGYSAAVGLASVIGGISGGMAVGKNKTKVLGQQPYAPAGAALFGAGAAAALYPTPDSCTPCAPLPTGPAPGTVT